MKTKIYVNSGVESFFKKINPVGGQVTAREMAYQFEKMHKRHFRTKESLISWYLTQNDKKLLALSFLIRYCYENGYKNILSLGAGSCVLEYFLKCALPKGAKVVATDFNPFLIKKAKLFFKSIVPLKFDFLKEDLDGLLKRLKISFDVAVFFGSAYVMDDSDFVRLLRKLKKSGIKKIVDFHVAYIPPYKIPIIVLSKILNKLKHLHQEGKFYGYERTRGELRRLYRQAGFNLIQETSVEPYKYIAIIG